MPHSTSSKPRVAVIGAGVAGLAAAKALASRGISPTVFEKSRGLGGRVATRRMDEGLAFDHGAQYFTARGAGFREAIAAGLADGSLARWEPALAEGEHGSDWFVGRPAMNSLVGSWQEGLDVRLASEISAVRRDGEGWRLETAAGDGPEPFDAVVSTAPAPQASRLFSSVGEVVDGLRYVRLAPCWSLMVVFAAPFDPGFDVRRADGDDVAWICRNAAKPGRGEGARGWVVHAGPDWSLRHLDLDGSDAASAIVAMLRLRLGRSTPAVERAVAHRWRYARTTAALGQPFLQASGGTALVGGDWTLGARVETAFESGHAMAEALADRLAV